MIYKSNFRLVIKPKKMNLEIGKKHFSNCSILFKKLKGSVKTETNRKLIRPGEWFIPISNDIQFKWMGISSLQIFVEED